MTSCQLYKPFLKELENIFKKCNQGRQCPYPPASVGEYEPNSAGPLATNLPPFRDIRMYVFFG